MKSWVVRRGFGEYQIFNSLVPPEGQESLTHLRDELAGRNFVHDLVREWTNQGTLESIWKETSSFSLFQPSGQQLIDDISRAIVSGQICVTERRKEPPLERLPFLDLTPEQEPDEPEAEAVEIRPTGFVEILVVDDDGVPVEHVKVEVKLPDDTVVTRSTDSDGLVRIDGIEDEGKCDVTLTKLDTESWDAA